MGAVGLKEFFNQVSFVEIKFKVLRMHFGVSVILFSICIFVNAKASPVPIDDAAETLASEIIDVVLLDSSSSSEYEASVSQLKRQDMLLNDTVEMKRQDMAMNDSLSAVVKRQLSDEGDMSNATSTDMVKRCDVLSLEVIELTTRQLEDALTNETVLLPVNKRLMIQNQVLKNRQLINETLEAVKRQLSENITLQVIVAARQLDNDSITFMRRQDLNDTTMLKRQELNDTSIVVKRQDLNESSVILKRQDEFLNDTDIVKRQEFDNDTVVVMQKRQDDIYNGTLVAKRQDPNGNETAVGKRQEAEANMTLVDVEMRNAVIGEWLDLSEGQVNETGVNLEVRAMAANSLSQLLDLPSSGLDIDIDYSKLKNMMSDSAQELKQKTMEGTVIFAGIWESLRKQFSDEDVWFDSSDEAGEFDIDESDLEDYTSEDEA